VHTTLSSGELQATERATRGSSCNIGLETGYLDQLARCSPHVISAYHTSARGLPPAQPSFAMAAREDMRKKRELEEARKAGELPPEQDVEGNLINLGT
jgi:hypothetical protein